MAKESGYQKAIAVAKLLPMKKSEEAQCATHLVGVRISDCEKQNFRDKFDSMISKTALCFDNHFWKFFEECRFFTHFWRNE